MGLLKAVNAAWARMKVGGFEGVLIGRLRATGPDSPSSKEMISQVAKAAWNIRILSEALQKLGFCYEDYETMYHAAVLAFPDILINNKNLFATFLWVDTLHKLGPQLLLLANAVNDLSGELRTKMIAEFSKQLTSQTMESVNRTSQ